MIDENNIPTVSDSDKPLFFNKSSQKKFIKDYEDKNIKLIDKNDPEMNNFFNNNGIFMSVNHLKEKK